MRFLLLIVMLLPGIPAEARTLSVGASEPFPNPSAASHAAQDGDIVQIEPGDYYDCAVWTQNHLMIVGTRPGVVITDTTCQGKAVFVVTGEDTTIRNLTLARARVPDGNGAGIRQEGMGLTLERVRFVNNQAGLIAGAAGASAIRIADCAFEGAAAAGERPAFAVLVGAIRLLQIEGSIFTGGNGGQISTAAARTELTGNQIGTGTAEAPVVAVMSARGHLVMADNLVTIGPNVPPLAAAVVAMGEDAPELRRNRLQNETPRTLTLLLNWTPGDPVLENNQVEPGDTEYATDGLWWHRASTAYHSAKDGVRALAGQLRHRLADH